MSHTWLRTSLLLTLAGLLGCHAPGYTKPAVPYDSAASLFDRASISYTVDAGKLQVPVSVAHIEGQLVSYQQVPSAIHHGATVGRLEIEYPHPNGKAGYALARVKIESKFPGDGSEPASFASRLPVVGQWVDPPTQVEESWELDVPRGQLDRIVAELNHAQYFDRGAGRPGAVTMRTRIDGRSVDKSWDRVPELDELMVAVRSQGCLVAYHRSQSASRIAAPAPSSIAAYRANSAEQAAYGHAPAQALAAGYALPGVSANPATGYGAPHSGQMIAGQQPPGPEVRVSELPSAGRVR